MGINNKMTKQESQQIHYRITLGPPDYKPTTRLVYWTSIIGTNVKKVIVDIMGVVVIGPTNLVTHLQS